MEFKDAKLIYEFAETDYDMHEVDAQFLDEAAAIEFGAHNLAKYKRVRRGRKPVLLDFDIRVVYDSFEQSQLKEPFDTKFWKEYEVYYKEVNGKIAKRANELLEQE